MFLFILLVTVGLTKKLKPPTNSPSICYNPPCTMKAIHVQIYVDDELWEKTRNGNVDVPIKENVQSDKYTFRKS